MSVDTKRVTLNIDGQKFTIDLPQELSLREQQNCAPNHLCGLFRGQLCCLEVKIEPDGDSISVFEMRNCSKNPERRGLKI